MTGPSPALSLPVDHVLELRQVLLRAAEHLARGRLPTRILHDLHYNAARLETPWNKGRHPRTVGVHVNVSEYADTHDNKKAPR